MAIGTKIKIGFDATKVKRGMADLKRSFGRMNRNFGKAFSGLISSATKFAAALGAAATAAAAFAIGAFAKSSSQIAASMETATIQFKVLLGSLSKAKDRMKELKEFSKKTPFEPKQVIAASKALQVYGGELLATGKGLRMVGDAGSMAKDLETTAQNVGKLFQGLTTGTELAEPVNQLQTMGVLLPGIGSGMKKFSAAMRTGKVEALSGAQALAVIEQGMRKTAGTMEEESKTIEGKLSTLRGNIDILKEAFGAGLNEAMRGPLDTLIALIPQYEGLFAGLGNKVGKVVGDGIRKIGPLFKDALEGNFKIMGAAAEVAFIKLGMIARASFDKGFALVGAKVRKGVIEGIVPDIGAPGADDPNLPINKRLAREEMMRSTIASGSASDLIDNESEVLVGAIERLRMELEEGRKRAYERAHIEGGSYDGTAFAY